MIIVKCLLLPLLLIPCLGVFGQENNEGSKKVSYYISAGLSMSNTDDFKGGAYPSLEVGIMGQNVGLGLINGRGSLRGLFASGDEAGNYFTELKPSVFVSLNKSVGVYGLFGMGSYWAENHFFIEYGGGFTYTFKKFGYFVQASNWDNVWYVTPGVSYVF